ncbi:S-adenosyl-L-methionine-dependent methyltransferase [Xylariaceae sp. FL0016]|nr:S-adenosyl-L-methionine-dependent methyltransferase [Xylariaceae sp. FL0016]
MESLLDQIKQIAAAANESSRHRIIASLRRLANSLEEPDDTTHRIASLHLETATVKTGFDLGLFRYLCSQENPLSLEVLAHETGADSRLLKRLLVYLATTGAIEETGKDLFAANNVTKNLAQGVAEAGISHHFETCAPLYQTMPAFLRKTGCRDPVDSSHTVWQDAMNTSESPFSWFASHPENHAFFDKYMALRRDSSTSWLTVYPVEQEAQDWDAAKPLLVNIGGGVGHQCADFVKTFPDLPGRIILQDLPGSIERALPTPKVENMALDFFEPQPIQGAKFYFARHVLHDFTREQILQILAQTRSAMTSDSIFILDEMLLPETGVSHYAAYTDLTMMAAFASRERSEIEWREIIEEAHLKLVDIYVYNPMTHESVMDVRLG